MQFKIAALMTALGSAIALQAEAAVLRGGESLTQGQRLYSDSGKYFATLQTDGNFIIYRNDGHLVWATYTHGKGAVRAIMQTDGNFVLYNGEGHAVWSTGTQGEWHMFAVTELGRAMILKPRDWWQSRTGNDYFAQGNPLIFPYGFTFKRGQVHHTGGPHAIAFQHDGNMVLTRNGQAIWTSNTVGATEAKVGHGLVITHGNDIRFQAKKPRKEISNSGTVLDHTLGYVAVFPNGNLVAYRAVPVWSANEFDWKPGSKGDLPYCAGNPNVCGDKLHRWKGHWTIRP